MTDAIYADKVRRARAAPKEQKMGWGPELFAEACIRMKDGIRHQFPGDGSRSEIPLIEAIEQTPPGRRTRNLPAQGRMKDGNEVAARVVEALDKLGVEYMLAGSFSSNLYGIPRSTKDADFVAVLGGSQLSDLQRELGSAFEFDQQPSFETVTGTFR
ncbi:MAG: hypothetical protein R3F11_02410 [Verrucomicrobiales bacterium]